MTGQQFLNISEVQVKFDLLHSCLMKAVDTFFSSRKVKISATDKPWIKFETPDCTAPKSPP